MDPTSYLTSFKLIPFGAGSDDELDSRGRLIFSHPPFDLQVKLELPHQGILWSGGVLLNAPVSPIFFKKKYYLRLWS